MLRDREVDVSQIRRRWWRRIPNWLSVGAAAVGIVGGLIVIFSSTINVVRWAGDQLYQRDREYTTLTSLKAGFDVRYFEEQLGQPVFSRTGKNGYVEYTFRESDYWAQAIAHRGAVDLYAVTSCDPAFNPTFTIPSEPENLSITLKKTTLGSMPKANGSYDFLFGANVFHVFEGVYGALPGHYKTYAWGTTTTCEEPGMFDAATPSIRFGRAKTSGSVADMPPRVKYFAHQMTVNTYAETSTDAWLFNFTSKSGPELELTSFHGFQIGPSTVLWRSVSSEPLPGYR